MIRSKEKKGEYGKKVKEKMGKEVRNGKKGGWEKDDDEEERDEC